MKENKGREAWVCMKNALVVLGTLPNSYWKTEDMTQGLQTLLCSEPVSGEHPSSIIKAEYAKGPGHRPPAVPSKRSVLIIC